MNVEAQNKTSGVLLYILRARELAEDPASDFRQGRAPALARVLPVLDKERIGFVKYNLAKSIQMYMRNARRLARIGLAGELGRLCADAARVLEVLADEEPADGVRSWHRGAE